MIEKCLDTVSEHLFSTYAPDGQSARSFRGSGVMGLHSPHEIDEHARDLVFIRGPLPERNERDVLIDDGQLGECGSAECGIRTMDS